MSFSTYLQSAAGDVDKHLDLILSEWQTSLERRYPALTPFISAFVEHCRGGKRIRGALVKLGYELTGKSAPAEIFTISAAYEVFQTAILAHDDIIDRSELRRGKPSLYKALGGDHYGVSQTISLGDLGFFLATELIAKSNFPAENKNEAIRFFTHIMQQTAMGEILDVYYPTIDTVSDQDILTIMQLKTAPYSIIGPLSVGAILADGKKSLLETIREFGNNLGIAYQIHDDVLGIFADEEILGKPNVSDIIEGKRTHLYHYAKEHAEPKQREQMHNLYGNPNLNKTDVETIQAIFKDTGAYEYATDLVRTYTREAKLLIPKLTDDSEQQTLLHDIARFLSERKK